MRVFPRFALFAVILAMSSPTLLASDQFHADCPLTLVGNSLPASTFTLSPAGAFRSGSQVFVLRGQTVSTFNVTDLGDLQIAREDFVNQMATRETGGGVAFSNGVLFVSGDAGLEIFDLRNVNRPAAGGIAGSAALQPANPVYPGKSNHRPDQHRPDGDGNPAHGSRGERGAFRHIVCHSVSDTAMQSLDGSSR